MQLGFGYLIGSAIFAAVLIVLVGAQIAAKRFQPFLYWAVIRQAGLSGRARRRRPESLGRSRRADRHLDISHSAACCPRGRT